MSRFDREEERADEGREIGCCGGGIGEISGDGGEVFEAGEEKGGCGLRGRCAG